MLSCASMAKRLYKRRAVSQSGRYPHMSRFRTTFPLRHRLCPSMKTMITRHLNSFLSSHSRQYFKYHEGGKYMVSYAMMHKKRRTKTWSEEPHDQSHTALRNIVDSHSHRAQTPLNLIGSVVSSAHIHTIRGYLLKRPSPLRHEPYRSRTFAWRNLATLYART